MKPQTQINGGNNKLFIINSALPNSPLGANEKKTLTEKAKIEELLRGAPYSVQFQHHDNVHRLDNVQMQAAILRKATKNPKARAPLMRWELIIPVNFTSAEGFSPFEV